MKTIIQNGVETVVADDTPCKAVNGVLYALSDEDQTQIERDQAEWESGAEAREYEQFCERRRTAYGSIGDQLDMQYWDLINGTTNWVRHVQKVKQDIPKLNQEE